MKFIVLLFLLTPMIEAKNLIIGDSIFHLTKEVPNNLKQAGLVFDNYSMSGARIKEIVAQYERYKKNHGIPELIIMDGGGNDILLGKPIACLKGTPSCYRAVDEVIEIGENLITQMKQEGVERIIFVGIHYLKGWRIPYNRIMDYAATKFICQDLCTYVDVREPFKANGLILPDGIHPNAKGSKIISDLILEKLEQ